MGENRNVMEGFETNAINQMELIEKDFGIIMRGLTSLNRTLSGTNIPINQKILYLESIENAKLTLSRMESDCKESIKIELNGTIELLSGKKNLSTEYI